MAIHFAQGLKKMSKINIMFSLVCRDVSVILEKSWFLYFQLSGEEPTPLSQLSTHKLNPSLYSDIHSFKPAVARQSNSSSFTAHPHALSCICIQILTTCECLLVRLLACVPCTVFVNIQFGTFVVASFEDFGNLTNLQDIASECSKDKFLKIIAKFSLPASEVLN